MDDLTFSTDPAKARKWKIAGDPGKIIDALFQRVEQLEAEKRAVKESLEEALSIDGAHHKQWYLWKIAEELHIELPDDLTDKGIAP